MGILDAPAVTKTEQKSPSVGAGERKAANAQARVAVLTGHSLAYGQDTTASGTGAPANGASQKRSTRPTPEQLAAQAGLLSPGPVTVVNQGFPGDTSQVSFDRWANGTSGDVEFVWVDTNDGVLTPGLTDTESIAAVEAIVSRARRRGSEVILIGGAPSDSLTLSREVRAAWDSFRAIAARMGVHTIDAGDLLNGLPKGTGLWVDGLHLTASAYALVGRRTASLLGARGTAPLPVSPGTRITPRDMTHVGSTVTARTGAADGFVYRLSGSGTLGISVDVRVPCRPVARVRFEGANGFGALGVYPNGSAAGQSTERSTFIAPTTGVAPAGGAYAWVPLPPLMSVGPDSIVLKAETGTIEVDAIEFLPLGSRTWGAGDVFDAPRTTPLQFSSVGSAGSVRATSGYEVSVDKTGAASLRASDGVTKRDRRWTFNVTLGNLGGVTLAQTLDPASGNGIGQGYRILRIDGNLRVSVLEYGAAAVDTTINGVFPSTALTPARCVIECAYVASADELRIYVDGTLRHTIAAPTLTYLLPGLVASDMASGFGSMVAPLP